MSKSLNPMQQSFQQKIKVLSKLFEGGCRTEKELQTLELAEMLNIPNITVSELSIIVKLQRAAKTHTLYSYLGGGTDEQQGSEPADAGEFYQIRGLRQPARDEKAEDHGGSGGAGPEEPG